MSDSADDEPRVFDCSATWDGRHWRVRCSSPVVSTTTRTLAKAVDFQRRALANVLRAPECQVRVQVRPVLPENVYEHLGRARELRETAAWANRTAAGERRAAARGMAALGLSLRDIGWILGVSYQRAQQLIVYDGPAKAH